MRRSLPRAACALAFALVSLVPSAAAVAGPQPSVPLDAARLRLALQRLQVAGSALYVAAHPDDENTAALAWLAQGRLVRAGYLSMTRGDGGQNLIGAEQGDALGVIRTQELLAARRIDGAEQFFTRAVDFGYSKSPEETFAKWGRDSILADVVRIIRAFRPDVILTRFPTDGGGGGGHGHHTASAILAEEAFAAAADPARFPECGLPWRATRIAWNVFRGGNAAAKRVTVDLGAYSPLLGRSFTELAGESRTMHKSQGFGSAERRGSIPNTFELRAGTAPDADLFDGVDLSWRRFPGGAALQERLAEAERAFDPRHPERVVPLLMRARDAFDALPQDEPLVRARRAELIDVVRACRGLWVEAIAAAPAVAPGDTLRVNLVALDRAGEPLVLERVELPFGAVAREAGPDSVERPALRPRALESNRPLAATADVALPEDVPVSQPYWLRARRAGDQHVVADARRIGAPEDPPALAARFVFRIGADTLVLTTPVVSRSVDPVEGERYRDLVVEPPVTLGFDRAVAVFPDRAPRELRVTARAGERPAAGTVRLVPPAGWSVSPAGAAVSLARGEERVLTFRVTPGAPGTATLGARFEGAGGTWDRARVVIDHPHIPVQTLHPAAELRAVRVDLAPARGEIAYVMGSGDALPEALRQMGWRVTLLHDDDLVDADLSRFAAVVTGVRAYNTRERLRALQPRLLEWVRGGGRLIVQYNTTDREITDALWPYALRISRERVTVEEAPVRLLSPSHPVLARPHPIGPADFEGWVQERGLYFADRWDARYTPLLSSNDPGEPARDGGLLVAPVGKGTFVYAGYAFFRQVPAGVPGAFRLLANLVAGGR